MAFGFKALIALSLVGSSLSIPNACAQVYKGDYDDAKEYAEKGLVQAIYIGAGNQEMMRSIENMDKRVSWVVRHPRVLRVEYKSECSSHLWLGPMTLDSHYLRSDRSDVLLKPTEIDIDWSTVASVSASGQDVRLRWTDRPSETIIRYGNNASASNMADAIDIMHRYCIQ